MLHAAKIRTGRFTSPHLIDRWDCITVDEKVIDESKFRNAEEVVRQRDLSANVKASEFELLTATAFEIFAEEKIEIGVIEVGVGGREDATNIIKHPLVTVITKIGKDHQSILGDTVEEIASHKAGIMKHRVPCVIDATNPANVFKVLETTAQEIGAGPLIRVPAEVDKEGSSLKAVLDNSNLERHQQINIQLAYSAARLAVQQTAPAASLHDLLAGVRNASWPGRLQTLDIAILTGRKEPVILDGAHNAQSAEVLGLFIKNRIRVKARPVTWVIAVSLGKEVRELLSFLFQPGDNVVAVKFGPVEGMPWVSPADPELILEEARSLGASGLLRDAGRSVRDALHLATETAAGNPVVIGGSLYLVSDVLRLLKDSKTHAINP
ncbi:MAG: hypothetical protein Q9179_001965 [Wetmoreana sp. 5 TL-2023]